MAPHFFQFSTHNHKIHFHFLSNFLSKFSPMDFLSGLAKGDQSKPTSDQPNPAHPANHDLFSSAKEFATQAQLGDKCDKAKIAGAAADLLDAASDYGKLDETKGVGKYVDQAETYLRQYNTPGATASGDHKNTTADAPPPAAAAADVKTAPTASETTESEKPSGGGVGDYVKMAEGFLHKPSGDGGEKAEEPASKSESGYGDLMKAAGGFFK